MCTAEWYSRRMSNLDTRPRITVISKIRNEGDIIDAWTRHCLSFADELILVLHQCEDATRSSLERLQREGAPLDIRVDDREAHDQDLILTAILQEIALRDPQGWVLPLDADEFLSGAANIRSAITALPPDRPSLIPWRTYIPTPHDDDHPHILQRITHRRAHEPMPFWKIIVPMCLARAGAMIDMGSHHLQRADGSVFDHHEVTDLFLAHFPVRSEVQIRRKVLHGWVSHCKRARRLPGEIFQWEMLFSRCEDARPIDTEELQQIANRYCIAPQLESAPLVNDPISLREPASALQ